MTVRRIKIAIPGEPSFAMELGGVHPQETAIQWYLDRDQLPEPELIHLMVRAIRPGDFVVDCGACTGFFTLLMGSLGATVLAIEPGENNLPSLYHNIGLNQFPIDVRPVALGTDTEEREFLLIDDGGANSFTQPADRMPGKSVTVPVRRLPDLVQANPRLIKMDIEGAEFEVLREWMCGPWQCPYIAIEYNLEALNRMDITGSQLRNLMVDWGYEMFILVVDGLLPLWVPEGVDVKCARQNTNVLFCKPADICKLWPELSL